MIAQIGRAVFGFSSPFFYILQLFTALILVLAANTAFNGFPVLASILAKDGYLPRQLHTRGDRLAFSNGILLLSGFAIVLIVAFNASPTRLIQLYIVGVFVSFTCSQTGMIRHWNRLLKTTTDSAQRLRMIRSRAINTIGAFVTGAVLVIVVISKFADGAWIAVAAMAVIWFAMRGVQRHYQSVAVELTPDEEVALTLPSSNTAIVLVSKLHRPTLRALAYAKATRPARMEAVTVNVDDAETDRLKADWDRSGIPLPLTVVSSPYREISRPVIEYVRRLRRESPRDIVTVYVPEYVLGHWWEQALHNQSALRLKSQAPAGTGRRRRQRALPAQVGLKGGQVGRPADGRPAARGPGEPARGRDPSPGRGDHRTGRRAAAGHPRVRRTGGRVGGRHAARGDAPAARREPDHGSRALGRHRPGQPDLAGPPGHPRHRGRAAHRGARPAEPRSRASGPSTTRPTSCSRPKAPRRTSYGLNR